METDITPRDRCISAQFLADYAQTSLSSLGWNGPVKAGGGPATWIVYGGSRFPGAMNVICDRFLR